MSLNLAPMIDVTFLLLIFFLLTTTFQRAEGVLGANLPKDRGAPAVALPISPVIVRVVTTGPSLTDYAIQIDNFAAQPTGFDNLTDFLIDIRRNEGFDEDTPVVLVVDPDAAWELAVDAWNAALRADCRNIAFGGQEK
jgi:biopolymer transport protein ExbD